MEYVLVLARVPVTARTGRRGGPAPEFGVVERREDGGALDAVLRRIGAQGLPTLADFDPHTEHSRTLKGPAVAALVRDIERLDLGRLPERECEVLRLLLGWGHRSRAEGGALRIRLSGAF